MNPDLYARLHAIDWASLEHSYGAADDIPITVAGLASGNGRIRNKARSYLRDSLNHQGVQRWEATARVIPFLIELLTNPTLPQRHLILKLLAGFAVGSTQGTYMVTGFNLDENYGPSGSREYGMDVFPEDKGGLADLAYGKLMREIYGEVLKGLPIYLAFLQDDDKEIRSYAAFLLGWLPTAAAQTVPAIIAQFRLERSPLIRSSYALALTYASLWDATQHGLFRADLEAALPKAKHDIERYAFAVSLVHLPDPHPAVKPILMEAMMQPARRGVHTPNNPWWALSQGRWLAEILLKRAPADWRHDILSAACQSLAHEPSEHDALDIASLLIEQLFTYIPNRSGGYQQAIEVEWDDLSDLQKLALRSLAAAPLVFYYANIQLILHNYGLPVYQDRLQALVEGRGDVTRFQYAAEYIMPPDFFARLKAVEWGKLRHSGGRATDLPDMLRALLDPDERQSAYERLRQAVIMGVRFPATPPMVPFLIEMLGNPAVPDRAELLTLLADCAVGNAIAYPYFGENDDFFLLHGFHPDQQYLPTNWREHRMNLFVEQGGVADDYAPMLRAIYDAVAAGLPLYLTALADDDHDMRLNAAFLLAWFTDRPAEIVPALLGRYALEPKGYVRASLVLALMHVTAFDSSFHADLRAQLQSALLSVTDDYERLALQVALLRLGDTHIVTALIEAALSPLDFAIATAWERFFEIQALVQFVLLHVPESARLGALQTIADWLATCEDEEAASTIGEFLITSYFPDTDALLMQIIEPEEADGSWMPLTPEQRLTLEAIVKNDGLWPDGHSDLSGLGSLAEVNAFLNSAS